ncbi:MAG: hypothetical protein HWN66_09225 [Candidatus Helarchaeota archaeon]|nr:hypothetical protein [Candidatus Helarchaeota archaeon]
MKENPEKSLESPEKLDILKFINDKNYQLIELADSKATAILGINGLMLTVIFAIGGFIPDFFQFENVLDYIRLSFFGAYLLFTALSLVFSILTISPLIEADAKPKKDIFYYNHILQFANKEEFTEEVKERLKDPSSLLTSLSNQIYSIAIVDKRKYTNIRKCILFIFISFIIFICLIVMMFI